MVIRNKFAYSNWKEEVEDVKMAYKGTKYIVFGDILGNAILKKNERPHWVVVKKNLRDKKWIAYCSEKTINAVKKTGK